MVKAKPKKPEGKVLVLRTCNANMSSAHDPSFFWPKEGTCIAPDWNPDPEVECGQGLHGLLWGNGNWSLLSNATDAIWMIVSVNPADGIVISEDKCRFKQGEVVYCGDQVGATTRILCSPEAMLRAQAEAKKASKSSGYRSTAASSGDCSTAASSGDRSTAASSGNCSTAASSGSSGIAMVAGNGGKAKAGDNGLIVLTWWNASNRRHCAVIGEVGIDGIESNTWYEVAAGKLVRV